MSVKGQQLKSTIKAKCNSATSEEKSTGGPVPVNTDQWSSKVDYGFVKIKRLPYQSFVKVKEKPILDEKERTRARGRKGISNFQSLRKSTKIYYCQTAKIIHHDSSH